jgi:hypothetical protein
MRAIGYQTTLPASLKPSSRIKALDRDNPFLREMPLT